MAELKLPLRRPVARRILVRFLRDNGWRSRAASGDHEVWTSPSGCSIVLPVRNGSTLMGNPFLRQINQAMLQGSVQSRARQARSRSGDVDS